MEMESAHVEIPTSNSLFQRRNLDPHRQPLAQEPCVASYYWQNAQASAPNKYDSAQHLAWHKAAHNLTDNHLMLPAFDELILLAQKVETTQLPKLRNQM